jgi:hypothetical protein
MSVYGRQKTDGENSDMTDKQEERGSDTDRAEYQHTPGAQRKTKAGINI